MAGCVWGKGWQWVGPWRFPPELGGFPLGRGGWTHRCGGEVRGPWPVACGWARQSRWSPGGCEGCPGSRGDGDERDSGAAGAELQGKASSSGAPSPGPSSGTGRVGWEMLLELPQLAPGNSPGCTNASHVCPGCPQRTPPWPTGAPQLLPSWSPSWSPQLWHCPVPAAPAHIGTASECLGDRPRAHHQEGSALVQVTQPQRPPHHQPRPLTASKTWDPPAQRPVQERPQPRCARAHRGSSGGSPVAPGALCLVPQGRSGTAG